MSEKFEREERYIVFKVKDLSEHKLGWVRDVIRLNNIPTVDAVVVESSWPEYEPTWTAIERRVSGRVHWDGQGLPPIGTACGVKNDLDGGWDAVDEVLAHTTISNADVAVFKRDDRVFYSPAGSFRPIPTPEQIAAEERKTAIDKMAADAQLDFSAGELLSSREYVECAIAALHDAGYRKQVAP